VPQTYRNGVLVIVIDCSDLCRSAQFWADALGYRAGSVPSGLSQSLIPGNGQGIEVLLQQVRDDKHAKNRLHLDLRTADLATQASRILGLGASLLTGRPVVDDGWRWHILADPDGNEFCVPQPSAATAVP
jgi:predicted enzyme related to lactoylglutathione lyase